MKFEVLLIATAHWLNLREVGFWDQHHFAVLDLFARRTSCVLPSLGQTER